MRPRRHRYTDGRCACGAEAPKPGQRVAECTRPRERQTSTAAVRAFRVRAALRSTCRDCLAPAVDGAAFCAAHREAARQRGRARCRRDGRTPRVGCPCGVAGHYYDTCPTEGERVAS